MKERITTYVLIGPPGAGKSTVGELLAQRNGLVFIDTDRLIEERAGKTIPEIFVEDGESIFRELEEQIVLGVLGSERAVISLGGGSILSKSVQNELKASSDSRIVVFLDVGIGSAAPRVGFNKGRPLLMMNPRSQWQELMNRRRPIYLELADHVIATDDISPEQVASKVAEIGAER